MAKPVRLQLSRRRGFDLQAASRAVNGLDAVNVARPSKWGNPFKVGLDHSYYMEGAERARAAQCVELFRNIFPALPESAGIGVLRGKNLACWCKLDAPCHADVLLELANAPMCAASGKESE